MLKLKKLQEQQQAAKKAAAAKPEGDAAPATTPAEGGEAAAQAGEGKDTFVLKKQNSKELLAARKSKSKENVFSLRTNKARGGRKKKTNAAELRATKDISEMEEIPGVVVEFPDQNNVMAFNVTVTPSDGLYKGASFKFAATIPQTYPYDPPRVECNTLIYHPNIDWEGHVCLNILRAEWMPVLNIGSVLFGLMTLFLEPNPDDPLNKEAAQLMIDKPNDFQRNVDQSLRGNYVCGRQFPKLK